MNELFCYTQELNKDFFLFTNFWVSTFDSRTVLTLMQFDAAVIFAHIELFLAQSEACAYYFFSLLIFKKVLYSGNEEDWFTFSLSLLMNIYFVLCNITSNSCYNVKQIKNSSLSDYMFLNFSATSQWYALFVSTITC